MLREVVKDVLEVVESVAGSLGVIATVLADGFDAVDNRIEVALWNCYGVRLNIKREDDRVDIWGRFVPVECSLVFVCGYGNLMEGGVSVA